MAVRTKIKKNHPCNTKCKHCGKDTGVSRSLYCNSCSSIFRSRTSEADSERQHQDKIQCRICKKYFILLASHTVQKHGLTGRMYRKRFGYNIKKGLIPKHYLEERRASVKKHPDVVKNLRKGPRFKKGCVPSYVRSYETRGRLVEQFL